MAKGRSKAHDDAIRFTFGGSPVIDAQHDMRVVPLAEDIKGAVKGDFGNCVFARACKRTANAKKVLFLRSVAYVELPDEKGNSRVERFTLPPAAQLLVAAFDQGKKIKPGQGFVLKAPSPSKKLGAERVRLRKRKDALLRGEVKKASPGQGSRPKSTSRKKDSHSIMSMGVRNGTGLIQMEQAREKAAS